MNIFYLRKITLYENKCMSSGEIVGSFLLILAKTITRWCGCNLKENKLIPIEKYESKLNKTY